jgi:hypothetical protein
MPTKIKQRKKKMIVMSQQQAEGLFSDLAKKALKAAVPIIKKEAKKQLPKLGAVAKKEALKRARKTKIGKQLGIGPGAGLRLAGQRGKGKREKQVRKRRAIPAVRVMMI